MKSFWTIIIILLAMLFAYLIVAYIQDWWPWEAVENTPTPTVTVTPTPSTSTSVTPTPRPTHTPVPGTRRVSSSAANFELFVPSDWITNRQEGKIGKQISYIEVKSPDFKSRNLKDANGNAKIYYDDGALLMINVVSGTFPQRHDSYSGNPRAGIIETKQITIDGVSATYHIFVHPTVYQGELIDTHLTYKNRTYLLTFAYNPSTLSNGISIFDNILDSFRFLD
mgnify:CR=1 FL=1